MTATDSEDHGPIVYRTLATLVGPHADLCDIDVIEIVVIMVEDSANVSTEPVLIEDPHYRAGTNGSKRGYRKFRSYFRLPGKDPNEPTAINPRQVGRVIYLQRWPAHDKPARPPEGEDKCIITGGHCD